MYPIELADAAVVDLPRYRHLHVQWFTDDDRGDIDIVFGVSVYSRQLLHWDAFRRWQEHTRYEGRPRYHQPHETNPWQYADTAYNIFVTQFLRDVSDFSYENAARRLLEQHELTRPFSLSRIQQSRTNSQNGPNTWFSNVQHRTGSPGTCTRDAKHARRVGSALLRPGCCSLATQENISLAPSSP